MSVFGHTLRVMTFGESHGKGVGCILEGLPPGLALTEHDVQVSKSAKVQAIMMRACCMLTTYMYFIASPDSY